MTSEESSSRQPTKRRRVESPSSSEWTEDEASASTTFSYEEPTLRWCIEELAQIDDSRVRKLVTLHKDLNDAWVSHLAILRAFQRAMSRLFTSKDLVDHRFEAVLKETQSLVQHFKDDYDERLPKPEDEEQVDDEEPSYTEDHTDTTDSRAEIVIPSRSSKTLLRQPRTSGKGIAFRRPAAFTNGSVSSVEDV